MQVRQCRRELAAPLDGLCQGNGSFESAQRAAEALALDVLEHKIGLGAVVADIKTALNTGVVEAARNLGLPTVALKQPGVSEQLGVRHLQHNNVARLGVARLIGLGV